MKAQLIKPDGTVMEVEPENGKDFGLQELYRLLECDMVQLLKLPGRKYMIIDEEGKIRRGSIPVVNTIATVLWKYDTIVGNAIICDKSMFK